MNPLPIGTRVRVRDGTYANLRGAVARVQQCPYRLTHLVQIDGLGPRWFRRDEIEEMKG